MADSTVGGHVKGFATTMRRDTWWVPPVLTVVGLLGWGIYYLWAAWQAEYFYVGPYLSPAYSPLFFAPEGNMVAPVSHAFFGAWPTWWPDALPSSPAFLIFMFPGVFRGTCYYYRKAYYRSFFAMPPGCAVGPAPTVGKYNGETSLLIFQNLHRYTLYIAILFIPLLFWDAGHTFFLDGKPGIGVGSIVVTMTGVLLACYTFGCHSWRHLIGGKLNCFSCNGVSEVRHGIWGRVTWLNERHMNFAWLSLFWFAFADLYVRLLAMGIIPDINTWHGITWAGDF